MGQDRPVASFEAVADEYDAARPSYPPGVYDSLGQLDGLRVLDVGAGTGIATRQLLARGASVIAVDPGREVLGRAVARTAGLRAVVADGAALPVRDGAAELVCFAQAWHWLNPSTRVPEVHRILAEGGRWAGWWSHARADGDPWFDTYWSAIEQACPGTRRGQRDHDWGATVGDSGHFEVGERITIPWTRTIAVDDWMTDQASHSYIAALAEPARSRLLDDLRHALTERFSNRDMTVPYETWLWIATKTPRPA